MNGQLETAFKKLATLHAKNDFSFAIVSGNLFNEDDESVAKLLNGGINVPVTTYFTVGKLALPLSVVAKITNDEEICDNLHYLGKRSVHKTSDGIRIVTLGGLLDPTIIGGPSKEQHLPFHTLDDAKVLRGAGSADILLTTVWPANVWKGSNVDIPVDTSSIRCGDAVSDLVAAIRPRYHFSPSTGDFAYEREPFYHPQKDAEQPAVDITRFISLAPLGNPAKAKALYAFSLTKDVVTSPPAGSTVTPFGPASTAKKRRADFDGDYRFSRGHDDHQHRRRRRERSPPPGPDRCFFCLSNPNLPTHMVCSIGDDAYLATAKGPLPLPTSFEAQGLGVPGHMIIVPFTHAASISTAAMADSAASTFKEMTRFRESLQGMVSTKTKRKLGGVTWEINRSRNIHTHWQFLPVSAKMVRRGLVEAAFRVEAENLKLPKLEARDFGNSDDVEGDYFRVWIWAEVDDNGESGAKEGGCVVGKSLVMPFDESVRFDLQYGRKVMAKLLGLEDRAVWQNCVQDEKEETSDVAAFREVFKEWDFTLAS